MDNKIIETVMLEECEGLYVIYVTYRNDRRGSERLGVCLPEELHMFGREFIGLTKEQALDLFVVRPSSYT